MAIYFCISIILPTNLWEQQETLRYHVYRVNTSTPLHSLLARNGQLANTSTLLGWTCRLNYVHITTQCGWPRLTSARSSALALHPASWVYKHTGTNKRSLSSIHIYQTWSHQYTSIHGTPCHAVVGTVGRLLLEVWRKRWRVSDAVS